MEYGVNECGDLFLDQIWAQAASRTHAVPVNRSSQGDKAAWEVNDSTREHDRKGSPQRVCVCGGVWVFLMESLTHSTELHHQS